jgi:hypothetical protein
MTDVPQTIDLSTLTDEEFMAQHMAKHKANVAQRETFSDTPKNRAQPLPPTPQNPMSIYSIAPPDSPLSSIYPTTSPVVPQRKDDDVINISSSHVGDDVEMVENSGEVADLADGLDTDEVVEPEPEPEIGAGEDGELDEDDDGDDDDDSDDDEDSEEDDDDEEGVCLLFLPRVKAQADL